MTHQRFSLDVDPEQIRAARARLKRVLDTLEERTPGVMRTPDEIASSWTGPGATRVKSEMAALGDSLDTASRPLESASRALRSLADAYRDALDELSGLNRRWDNALGDYAVEINKVSDRHSVRLENIVRSKRTEAEVNQARRDADTAHDSALESAAQDLSAEKRRIIKDFEAVQDQARADTRTAARALDKAMILRATPFERKQAMGGFEGPARRRHWTELARRELAKSLPLTGKHHEARAWREYLKAHDMEVPSPYDEHRAAALTSELDDVLAALEGMDDEARSKGINNWAGDLDPDELALLAIFDAPRVGNLDGIPNKARYAANRVNVATALQSELARLADYGTDGHPKGEGYAEYKRLRGRVAMLERLMNQKNEYTHPATGEFVEEPFQIYAFVPPDYSDDDTVVDDGRLAVAIGDLDSAKFIGTVVPGITNRIDNFENTLSKARNLHQETPQSATVAWLGYDTPEFADMVTEDRAEVGGAALKSYMNGMVRNGMAETSVLAHSYGTLVTSKALQLGMHPDRVVFFGSPGLGANIFSRDDLNIPDDVKLYAMRAYDDFVSVTAPLGMDPAEMDGITRLDTDWLGAEDVTGHSSYTNYLEDESGTEVASDSLANLAGVLAGWTTAPDNDGNYLVTGGNPLAEDGGAGRYNDELRRVIDLLLEEVPGDEVAKFVRVVEPRVLDRIDSAGEDPKFYRDLAPLVLSAMRDSDLGLSPEEMGAVLIKSGLTGELGRDAGDRTRSWFAERDGLDDFRLPVVTKYGTFHLEMPDQANEVAGVMAGFFAQEATESLANLAVVTTTLGARQVTNFVNHMHQRVELAKLGVDVAQETGRAVASTGRGVADAARRSPANPMNWRLP